MKIGVVIDSACDLPRSYIDKYGLNIVPINLRFGGELFVDERDPQATMRFYQRYLANKNTEAETEPPEPEKIKALFLEKLVLEYDRVLMVTLSKSRSETFENANQASYGVMNEYKAVREKKGIDAPFAMRVLDSKTLFTGQAVLVHETLRLIRKENLPLEKLRPAVDTLSEKVYAHLIPEDLHFVYHRARKKGDKSVGWLSFKLGSALDMKPIILMNQGESRAIKKIQGFENAVNVLLDDTIELVKADKLLTNTICMSYAGNPEVIKRYAKYKELCRIAKKHGVETMLSVMSTTAGVNVGPGSFSLAYIKDE
ncbi:DegV family protein with EDD domain [Natronospira proteinivora]|uniref:DegV family protein with EDD domain n=1 Tax=Natronospira proteinivora TaxID=1807133 RepID=A0ABT1G686_9GAMM|nr:DegV family protein [Natronospira proteinivora]MCP1726801.1 DegV family protein with EDD domain [Natronospira proteinivora]